MDKGHWFWHSTVMNKVEQWLLDLTHWVWAKRHDTLEVESVPRVEPKMSVTKIITEKESKNIVAEPARPARKTAVKKPKPPKGNEWSVK